MSILNAAIMGILQGLTEFLPISSSGHLVLMEEFLRVNPPGILYEVSFHFGTAIAVLFIFQKRVRQIIYSVFHGKLDDPNSRFLFLLFIGSIPAGLIGILFRSQLEQIFDSGQASLWASTLLLVTGLVLFFTKYTHFSNTGMDSYSENKEEGRGIGMLDALKIGAAQAAAILPGLSRSGLTIATGLYSGLRREETVEFSFLLALPAIFGAMGIEVAKQFGIQNLEVGIEWIPVLVGTFLAFVSGLFAIKVLLAVVKRGNLARFAYYCWGVGILGIILSVVRH
jgi:undecaprenyl-diphosphatase